MSYRSKVLDVAAGGTAITSGTIVSSAGSSTDTAIPTWNGTGGSSLNNNSTVLIDASGRVTNSAQPCFTAYVSGTIADVTGDGTAYTVIFNAEISDRGSNFNTTTGIFTAPVAGFYYLCTNLTLIQLTAAHTSAIINIVAGGQTTTVWSGNPGAIIASGIITVGGGIAIQMTASSTAYVTVTVSGSTKVVDVQQFFTQGSQFFGYLIA